MFYAVEYAYGATTVNHGNQPNTVRAFAHEADAEAWVDDRRTDYITDSGYRDRIPSSHPYVRYWRRHQYAYGPIRDQAYAQMMDA